MNENNCKYEIILNGKVVKCVTTDESLDKALNDCIGKFKTHGCKEIQSSSCGYSGYYIFFNEDSLECNTCAYRMLTDFVDKNGEKIYFGDLLAYKNKDGRRYSLYEHSEFFGDGWYIWAIDNDKDKRDITADEIAKDFVVIHSVYPSIK